MKSLNISLEVERIDNGFIVVDASDGKKLYHSSIAEIFDRRLGEYMMDQDRFFREHNEAGATFRISVNIENYE